jgi:hypothetical protein
MTEDLHITERALLPTFLNRLAPMGLKIKQERLEEALVKQMTRVVSVSVGVAYAQGDVAPPAARPAGSRSLSMRTAGASSQNHLTLGNQDLSQWHSHQHYGGQAAC